MFTKNPFMRNKNITNEKKELEIQLVEYREYDGDVDFSLGNIHEYEINMFGVTDNSETVCVIVKNYKPFYFIEVPNKFNTSHLALFEKFLIEQEYKNKSGETKKFKYALTKLRLSLSKKYKCDGFQKNTTKFLKIEFNSLFGYNKLKTFFFEFIISKEKMFFKEGNMKWIPRLYESDISPLLRFFHEKDIKTCGWVKIKEHNMIDVFDRKSLCQYECEVNYTDIESSERTDIGKLVIASFDIECTSGDGSFPLASRDSDAIIQIGTTFTLFNNDEVYYNNIITLNGCSDIENAEVITCETELEVLHQWCKLIKETNPDIITGYNINGFDFKYMHERMKHLISRLSKTNQDNYENNIMELGRIKGKTRVKTKLLESSALGQSELVYYELIGRINIDLLPYIRKEKKLDSYKLDNVAKVFIGSQKNDVTPNDIFRLFRGSDDDRKTVAEYCIQDCKLCNQLMDKLCVIPNTFGMANTCYVPNNYISFRGQGIKGHSLVVKFATEMGYIVPSSRTEELNTDYKGATVIEPSVGSHFYPVSCLDFASLYPSCMISHNLCITSIITDDADLNLPGRTYKSVSWLGDNGEEKKYTYIQPESEDKGALIPSILKILLQKRKDTRKKQKEVAKTNPFLATILDGLQLSYKITANSIYGLLGARTSAISRPEIAASITTTGRTLLDIASERVLKHFIHSSVVYGDTDSIFVKFELKRHTDCCMFHSSNIHKRMKAFEKFINKYKATVIENNEEIKHSLEETAELHSKFQIYKKCKCELIEDQMSKEALQVSIDMAYQAEYMFDILLPNPHKLEYEKTYLPYISFAKKRYVGYLYENDVNVRKLDCKGIVLKRRDNANVVKKFYNESLDKILAGKFDEALKNIDVMLNEMFNDKFDIDLFVLTKTLKTLNSYKISLLKRKFYIQPAEAFSKIRLLLPEYVNIKEGEAFLKIIKYYGNEHNEYVKGNKINIHGMIKEVEYIRNNLHLFDCNKLVTGKDKLYKMISYNTEIDSLSVYKLIDDFEIDSIKFQFLKKMIGSNKKIDTLKLLKSKKYKKIFKEYIYGKIPQSHVALNEKLRKNDEGSAFAANDRIPYCFIYKKQKKGVKNLQSDIVEIPQNIISNKSIRLDYLYYLEKQIIRPLIQLFETIDKDKEFMRICNKYMLLENQIRNGIELLI